MDTAKATAAIGEALTAISVVYWRCCDTAGRAVDPAELGGADVEAVLSEDFEAALRVEDVMRRDGCTWADARAFV